MFVSPNIWSLCKSNAFWEVEIRNQPVRHEGQPVRQEKVSKKTEQVDSQTRKYNKNMIVELNLTCTQKPDKNNVLDPFTLVIHMRTVVRSTAFDIVMSVVICMNMFIMAIHLQLEGHAAAQNDKALC